MCGSLSFAKGRSQVWICIGKLFLFPCFLFHLFESNTYLKYFDPPIHIINTSPKKIFFIHLPANTFSKWKTIVKIDNNRSIKYIHLPTSIVFFIHLVSLHSKFNSKFWKFHQYQKHYMQLHTIGFNEFCDSTIVRIWNFLNTF